MEVRSHGCLIIWFFFYPSNLSSLFKLWEFGQHLLLILGYEKRGQRQNKVQYIGHAGDSVFAARDTPNGFPLRTSRDHNRTQCNISTAHARSDLIVYLASINPFKPFQISQRGINQSINQSSTKNDAAKCPHVNQFFVPFAAGSSPLSRPHRFPVFQ